MGARLSVAFRVWEVRVNRAVGGRRRPRVPRADGGLRVLRGGLYPQLLVGNFVSALGVWLHTAAAAWVMLELTRSPLMVGIVTGAAFLPRMILGVPAGALIDVFQRRRMVIVGNLFQSVVALATGLLHLQGALGPWTLVTMTTLIGAGQALSMPAYHAVIQDVVPREHVAPAIALHSGSVNVARALGPAVGGALIASGRTSFAFLVNGVSYLAICGPALRIPRIVSSLGTREPMGRAMAAGLRFVRHSPLLVRVVLVNALFALTSANIQALLAPAAADRGLGSQGYGLLFSCFGAGAMLGAFTTGSVTRQTRRGPQAASIAVFGAAGIAFGLVPSVLLAGLAATVAGAAWVVTLATLNTTVQLSAPSWARGRVLSIYMMAFTGAVPAGALIAGAIAEAVGAALAIALMSGSVIGVAAITAWLRLPAVDEVKEPAPPEDWSRAPHARHVHGGPVMVLVTWQIAPEDLQRFLAAMRVLRTHRLRTGAVRWTLLRDPDDTGRMTEVYEVPDWSEHLRQHERLDQAAADAISHARTFDRSGAPAVSHLVGIDLTEPVGSVDWSTLLAQHGQEHGQPHGNEHDAVDPPRVGGP